MSWRCSAASNSGLVENLYRSNLITTTRVRDAMASVDRAHFAPHMPYKDAPIALGCGTTISAPHMHAMALSALDDYLKPGAHALDIGSGSGYLVAVMAKLVGPAGRVVGVEHIKQLNDAGEQRFKNAMPDGNELINRGNVEFVCADGRLGKPGEEFDAIHVGAAINVVPDELLAQLKAPGKMFIPVGDFAQYIYEITKTESGQIVREKKFGVSYVPLTDLDEYDNSGDIIPVNFPSVS
ncbi:protein-L-isoaspartate O-methyltransferase [Lipomyces japonicus]|uniref:protein-L-isoaspartate O-methyltransferase n=1 Tax=Lipomyces japonicus TaxID=56871 RepID=UPI0034CF0F18